MYLVFFFFFFNDTATTEIYTLSLHDALPIFLPHLRGVARTLGTNRSRGDGVRAAGGVPQSGGLRREDRKSTRLNSSHANISYAVFCLKKKKNTKETDCNVYIEIQDRLSNTMN